MSPSSSCSGQQIDSVSFSLLEEHDFGWLRGLGSVFQVFDQQDSGNICFGVENGGRRSFIKYAGARTLHYAGSTQAAIAALKEAMRSHHDLKHECLVSLERYVDTRNGFAAVFEWFDGEDLHTDPRSPFYRFRKLPIAKRLKAFDSILRFHECAESRGYVAVDFYDGSILYDFRNDVVKICDIDFYQRKPCVNSMGRLWGSSRFMSPEEFELGASIDERTNVFCMGATAFCLLGGELDRSIGRWEASEELFTVACRAVSPERDLRYASVAELSRAWRGKAGSARA